MSRSTPKNLVKKIQIATDRKFKCGQIPFESNNPFCICWQEPASVFRCNILSVAEEPLRRNVAGKGSKRRQSQLCKMWKWAHIRLPPPSKTCDARGELSEVQTWFTSGRNKSHLSLRLSWSFPNSSLRLQLPGELDGTLVFITASWMTGIFPLMFLSLAVCDSSGIVLAKPRTGREVPELRSQNSCSMASLLTPRC